MIPTHLRCPTPGCGLESDREDGEYLCRRCHGLLELTYDYPRQDAVGWPELWRARGHGGSAADRSGVWRFRELLPLFDDAERVVSLGEGATPLVDLSRAASWAGVDHLSVKHQGANPTGSFKDLGMTVCITEAVRLGSKVVACASTGNTSSSMAAYAARAGLKAVVFVPRGAVSGAKLAQALDFGARVVEVGDNFDQAFGILRELAPKLGLYLVNSVNPFRLEGQKSIAVGLLEQCDWRPPDYIVLPGGNLGNTSAIGKGLKELSELGLLAQMPRLVVVQAEGAAPFHKMWSSGSSALIPVADPSTRATAIRIGNPANWPRARRVLELTEGLTTAVSDLEIDEAKRELAACGIGCEPASASTLAGVRRLRLQGLMDRGVRVVLILTGHQLKDTDYISEHLAGAAVVAGGSTSAEVESVVGRLV